MTWTGYCAIGSYSGTFTESTATGYSRQLFSFSSPVGTRVAGYGNVISYTTSDSTPTSVNAFAFYPNDTDTQAILVYPIVSVWSFSDNQECLVFPGNVVIDLLSQVTLDGTPLDLSRSWSITGVDSSTSSPALNSSLEGTYSLSPNVLTARSTNVIALNATYDNGNGGVGATLTGNVNGRLNADGWDIQRGHNLLVGGDESISPYNGVYIVTQEGDGSTPYILTRHPAADSGGKLNDSFVFVGDYGNTMWNSIFNMETQVNSVGVDNIYYGAAGLGGGFYVNCFSSDFNITKTGIPSSNPQYKLNLTNWTTGTGAPAATKPRGALYSRTDGGVGTTLYVSQGGGSWLAVAGV